MMLSLGLPDIVFRPHRKLFGRRGDERYAFAWAFGVANGGNAGN